MELVGCVCSVHVHAFLESIHFFLSLLPTFPSMFYQGTPEARYFEEGLVEDLTLPPSLESTDYAEFASSLAKDVAVEAAAEN